jgi:hypothetical protein
VKVGWRMLAVVHGDHDAEKAGDLWHDGSLASPTARVGARGSGPSRS